MTQSAAQADAFYSEALQGGAVWTLRDAQGIPAPMNREGQRAMPFWSSRSRAEKVIGSVPAYSTFEPVEVDLGTWRERWLPDLSKDGLMVGVNWSGVRATGYDVSPEDAERNLAARSE